MPRACPSFSALRTLRAWKMFSTATQSGRCSREQRDKTGVDVLQLVGKGGDGRAPKASRR